LPSIVQMGYGAVLFGTIGGVHSLVDSQPRWPALAAFAEFARIFNGPIPEAARLAARHGSSGIVLKIRARGEAGLFRAMARGQIQAIRRRRDDGSFYPALADDLAFYLRQWRAWRPRRRRTRARDRRNRETRHSEGFEFDG